MAFFLPGISGVAIPARFPETGFVMRGNLQTFHPFGTFIEIPVRNHCSHRPSVFGGQWFAVEAVRQNNIGFRHLRQGNACCIAMRRFNNKKTFGNGWPGIFHKGGKTNPSPYRVQQCPACDTMYITGNLLLLEPEKIFKGKGYGLAQVTMNVQLPILGCRFPLLAAHIRNIFDGRLTWGHAWLAVFPDLRGHGLSDGLGEHHKCAG